MGEATHLQAVAGLAAACRSADPAGYFAPAGLLAELKGRPGRAVNAWLAWQIGPSGGTEVHGVGHDGPLGLVALVAAGAGQPTRFSIAWLLVHPAARRRGVATALVAHAIAHAETLGAATVHAETSSLWPSAVGFWHSVGFEQRA